MLILSRQRDQSIVINDDITITIVEVRNGNIVRLGITAPPHVPVHRFEVYNAIQRERGQPEIDYPTERNDMIQELAGLAAVTVDIACSAVRRHPHRALKRILEQARLNQVTIIDGQIVEVAP